MVKTYTLEIWKENYYKDPLILILLGIICVVVIIVGLLTLKGIIFKKLIKKYGVKKC